jgi:hypothetical protein
MSILEVLLLVGGLSPSARTPLSAIYDIDDPKADHSAHAIKLDEEGDISGAIESFRAATRFTPKEPRVWTNLGVALQPENEPNGSADTLLESMTCQFKALELDSEYGPAHEALEELQETSENPLETSMQALNVSMALSGVQYTSAHRFMFLFVVI